jgi:hypothetical protein
MRPLARHYTRILVSVSIGILATASVAIGSSAQSLDPQKPAPMQPGPNAGTVDNTGGANYFYFWSGPGESTITATYKSMGQGFLGNIAKSDLNVELYDENKSWVTRTTISSLDATSQRQLHGSLKKETKLILAVIPPSGGLLASGGNYEVTATGAVRFDKPPSSTELIVGTYIPPNYTDENLGGAVKFKSDGTLEFASGTLGKWKIFDEDARIFTVEYLSHRFSLKLIPGRGLVDTNTSFLWRRNR